MGLALVIVEAEELPVLRAHAGCWWSGRLWDGFHLDMSFSTGFVGFLFQQLELTQLGKKLVKDKGGVQ